MPVPEDVDEAVTTYPLTESSVDGFGPPSSGDTRVQVHLSEPGRTREGTQLHRFTDPGTEASPAIKEKTTQRVGVHPLSMVDLRDHSKPTVPRGSGQVLRVVLRHVTPITIPPRLAAYDDSELVDLGSSERSDTPIPDGPVS